MTDIDPRLHAVLDGERDLAELPPKLRETCARLMMKIERLETILRRLPPEAAVLVPNGSRAGEIRRITFLKRVSERDSTLALTFEGLVPRLRDGKRL